MLSTKCFDPTLPALRFEFNSQGIVATSYDNLAKFQGKYLARAIQILGGNQKLFTAAVDSTNAIDPANPAIVPSKDAIFEPDAPHRPQRVCGKRLAHQESTSRVPADCEGTEAAEHHFD